jgi:hypothetical protein
MSDQVRRKLDLAAAEFDMNARLVDRDVKVFDVTDASTGVTNSGYFLTLAGVPQGQTDETRVGDFIDVGIAHVHVNLYFSSGSCPFRWKLVRWKQAQGAGSSLQTQGSSVQYANGFVDWDLRTQFDVLAEGHGFVDSYHPVWTRDITVKRPGPLQFEAASSTANSGQLVFAVFPVTTCDIYTVTRVEFTDV